MNKLFLILGIVLTAFCICSCQEEVAEKGPYSVSVIDEGIWHIQDYNSSNPAGETFDADGNKIHFNNCSDIYLIVGSDQALLIDLSNDIRNDSPDAVESLRSIVFERTAGKPLVVTFTHNHGDHIGMFPAFIDDDSVTFAFPQKDFEKGVPSGISPQRCVFINEPYQFDLGGVKVNALYVPGHSLGSMVFFVNDRNLLFSGDAVGSGHGVWIFDSAAFDRYVSAVPHLMDYIEDPENGIDISALRIFGGHWWQRDWLEEPKSDMGIEYLRDMRLLLDQMELGAAHQEPSGLDFPQLDTYFRRGDAIVVWNAVQAEQYRKQYEETFVYRGQDAVIRQIDEHTWEGNGHLCFNETFYIVEGEKRALLIDAGTNIRNLDEIVASITDKPVTLVATHIHPDHTGPSINCFSQIWFNPADKPLFRSMVIDYPGELKYLEDGQVFDLGGRSIEVMFTPGHTPGSTTFFDKERHYGFSGDSFGSTNLLLTTPFSTLIATTEKTARYMQNNNIPFLYPGHYHGDNKETLQRVLDLNTMSKEVLSGRRKGESEEGMMGLNTFVRDYGVTIRYNASSIR